MENEELANRIVLFVTLLILFILEIYSFTTNSHYKWDLLFSIGLMIAVFMLRKKIKLHPFHFTLFGIFLLLHNLGIFGTYKNFYLGMEYDFWVHSYFGLVSSLMLYRTYNLVGPYKGWFRYVAIIAIVLGFSAFHELFEYAGAVILGEGEGVLFIGAGDLDEWDTQKDMRNNLIGAVIGLSLYWVYDKVYGGKKKD